MTHDLVRQTERAYERRDDCGETDCCARRLREGVPSEGCRLYPSTG